MSKSQQIPERGRRNGTREPDPDAALRIAAPAPVLRGSRSIEGFRIRATRNATCARRVRRRRLRRCLVRNRSSGGPSPAILSPAGCRLDLGSTLDGLSWSSGPAYRVPRTNSIAADDGYPAPLEDRRYTVRSQRSAIGLAPYGATGPGGGRPHETSRVDALSCGLQQA